MLELGDGPAGRVHHGRLRARHFRGGRGGRQQRAESGRRAQNLRLSHARAGESAAVTSRARALSLSLFRASYHATHTRTLTPPPSFLTYTFGLVATKRPTQAMPRL
jgi:hypothetical protein